MTNKSADITSITDEIVSRICSAQPLAMVHLQTILALIDGNYNVSDLIAISKGEQSPFKIVESIVCYIPFRKNGRPRVNKIEFRDSDVAFYFDELRKEVSQEKAYEIISNESKEKYGVSLTVGNLPACVTRGRKFNKKYADIIAQCAMEDPLLFEQLKIISGSTATDIPE